MSFLNKLLGRDPETKALVDRAVNIFIENKAEDDETIHEKLVSGSIETETASQMIEFVPIAFGRVALRAIGVSTHDEYVRYVVENGQVISKGGGRFSREPIFKEAVSIASSMRGNGKLSGAFDAVALRSAELSSCASLIEKGSRPENIVLTKPHFQWRA